MLPDRVWRRGVILRQVLRTLARAHHIEPGNAGPIHHLALTVTDSERSRDFYVDLLGFQVLAEFDTTRILSNGNLVQAVKPAPDPARASKDDRFDENRVGLDHVLLVLHPDEAQSWRAIETILPEDLFMTVHLTATAANIKNAPAVLDRLARLGVENLSLSTAALGLEPELRILQEQASALGLRLRWDLPVPYSDANPVSLETRDDGVGSGAGHAWLYVEPDGDVLPAQGASIVLGNLLRDPWDKIRP